LTVKLLNERIRANSPGGARPLKPADCLVVEDAPKVIQSVKAAGFPTLAVATSYPLMKLGDADYRVTTLRPEEVLEQIPQLQLIT
jgi:beta-phosphoglucomutase-like phosphatase (HAD superfamily)